MAELSYVIDTSVFVQAARVYYAFDLAPKFWDTLIDLGATGRICSIDRVKKELERGKDMLAEWAGTHFSHAFKTTDDPEIVRQFSEIMIWVNEQGQFFNEAKTGFAKGADGWLIAHALVYKQVVVTQEVEAPYTRAKVPIPNVCKKFDVHCINTFEMLRELGIRFD